MQQDMDCIRFESRLEIEEVAKEIQDLKNGKKTPTPQIDRLIDLLEVMHMVW